MGFIQNLLDYQQRKAQERNDLCDLLISRINDALRDAQKIFSSAEELIDQQAEPDWKRQHGQIFAALESRKMQQLKKANRYQMLSIKQAELFDIAASMSQKIRLHNENIINKRVLKAYSLIGNVEGRKLDRQQMTCIVKDAHNHLVIAGAGTGKTTTVVGKIKYLLKTGKYQPQDILVLSFTNASASEMNERIAKETGCNIAASTFHKLGLSIIAKVNGVMPKISQLNLRKFVKDQLSFHMQADRYLQVLSSYLLYNRVVVKSEFDFMSASEAYRASMEWKRKVHRENHTQLIECYAYEKWEDTLLGSLKEKLEAFSVVLTPKSSTEMWAQVAAEGDSVLDGVIELFETLINLIKSNGYDIDTVRNLNQTGPNSKTNSTLLWLLEPIFTAYCNYLSIQNEIDFNDMINMASEYVRQGKYTNPYKYVIVDEYQDISKARFTLLECLRKSNDFDLFCVGDDWQSIYRFAGSDIGFILNFARYWGKTEISKIETTYRFAQKLIEISGNFIMQNPAQIKKTIRGKEKDTGFPLGEISGYNEKYAIEFMSDKLKDLPAGSTVFFLGRYTFDVKILNDSGLFCCQYNNATGFTDVKSRARPDLNIVFLTAHKSKGLQADYVFIVNNKRSRMGFPSKIQDAPILDLLLDNCDRYHHAEERRLFYVAITRAKKKTFIVTIDGKESEFAMELKTRYGEDLKRERYECPLCGGQLLKRTGPYGEFFGCSNYRTTGCTYKRKIKIHGETSTSPKHNSYRC